jgi:protein-S-isoprenylcysteine O-methyltransferase Ste14
MTHKETAYAQIGLTVLFIVGYFLVLFMFMAGIVRVPSDFKDAFTALLGVITASVVQILGYWFARQRPDTPPGSG